MNDFDWVDEVEKKRKEERSKGYFTIEEGQQQFVLLSHFAPYAQVYENGKYRPAVEGDIKPSIKGVCWVLQDGLIKEAKMPYTIVKEIRAIQQNPDWEFTLPFPHTFTLSAVGAGESTVKYSLTVSPKMVEIPAEILTELKKKPSPEDMAEKLKAAFTVKVPLSEEENLNPDDIPF